MGVEILILSGARQGEKLGLEAGEFRVGEDPRCEVAFDPREDPGIQGRSALFRLGDDGWSVQSTGAGEVLLNQQPIRGAVRIRSGDLVRMSEAGPDFSFSLVTRATASSSRPARVAPAGLGAAAETAASPPAAESPAPPAPPAPSDRAQPAPAARPGATGEPWRQALWAVVVLAVCALLVVGVCVPLVVGIWRVAEVPPGGPAPAPPIEESPDPEGEQPEAPTPSPKPEPAPEVAKPPKLGPMGDQTATEGKTLSFTIPVAAGEAPDRPLRFELGPDAPEGAAIDPETGAFTWPPTKGQGGQTYVIPVRVFAADSRDLKDEGSFRVNVESLWESPYRVVKEAVYLIEVESSGRSWPLATCFAISDDTVLCTARAACEMKWLRHQGEAEERPLEYKFSVTRRASGNKPFPRFPVKQCRISAPFAKEPECRVLTPFAKEGEKCAYVDLAVLTVDGKLPQVIPLASQDELTELVEAEPPVAIVGIGHDGQLIRKSFTGEPELAVGEVYVITRLDDSDGSPWMMHLKMDAPDNARGSPVINQRGHVVGVYSVPVPPQRGVEINLHYAPVVQPELIETWLKERNADIWVDPFIPDIPLEPKNTP